MATATENRKRKRRTFTMDDESYERLTPMADSAHTNRSRFLEQLILLAEPIFSWEMPPPRPWWKFWGQCSPAAGAGGAGSRSADHWVKNDPDYGLFGGAARGSARSLDGVAFLGKAEDGS